MTLRSTSKQAVVIAIGAMNGGGAERVVLDLVNHWPDDLHRPVLMLSEACGPYVKDIADHVEVIDLDTPLKVTNTLRMARRIRTALTRLQPVAVFTHMSAMSRMVLRARMLGAFEAPVVAVVHNNMARDFAMATRNRLTNAVVRAEMRWLYSSAEAVVGVSEGVATGVRDQLRLPPEHVHVVYNPVDFDKIGTSIAERPAESFALTFDELPRPIIISAGRLHPQKAFDDLIRAFALMPETGRGSLVILGQGELETELRSLAATEGVARQVHLPGFVSNPWWYMARSDLYAMSSHWEGFPMILLEALTCGLPVVSTDCPYGPREIIRSHEEGRLVPVGDPATFADAIQGVLQETDGLPQLNASAKLEQFTPATIARNYLQLLGRRQTETKVLQQGSAKT